MLIVNWRLYRERNSLLYVVKISFSCKLIVVYIYERIFFNQHVYLDIHFKVMSVLRSSMTCGITNVRLDWNMPEDCSLINVPEEVNTIFPGEKNILYAIVTENVSKVQFENLYLDCSFKRESF